MVGRGEFVLLVVGRGELFKWLAESSSSGRQRAHLVVGREVFKW